MQGSMTVLRRRMANGSVPYSLADALTPQPRLGPHRYPPSGYRGEMGPVTPQQQHNSGQARKPSANLLQKRPLERSRRSSHANLRRVLNRYRRQQEEQAGLPPLVATECIPAAGRPPRPTPALPAHGRRKTPTRFRRGMLAFAGWCMLFAACSDSSATPSQAAAAARGTREDSAAARIDRMPVATSAEQRSEQLQSLIQALAPDYKPTQSFTGIAQATAAHHLLVLQRGHCYRILGVGGTGVVDLDLALFDGDQIERYQDASSDRYPQLGVRPSLCPRQAQAYRLEVRAYRGQGPYSVTVYESPTVSL